MSSSWCFFILIVCVSAKISEINLPNDGKLVAVAVIFRHGDRSPIDSFPEDKYLNDIYWPSGLNGELTEYGIQRAYKLGQWLRKRYDGFLSETYSSKDIYTYSSDINRCLMSASSSLAGLFPPKGWQVWNDKLLWQPIPVHTNDAEKEEIFTLLRDCPKFNRLNEEAENVEFGKYYNNYKSFFDYFVNKTGWNEIDLAKISKIRSVFYVYENFNKSFIPQWMEEVDQNLLDYLSGVKYSIATLTTELTRLRVGPFYNYIYKYFNKFLSDDMQSKPQKFLLMSGQDTLISSVLNGMDCYDYVPVGFCDTLVWELKQINNKYVVNLLYKQGDSLKQLKCCKDCDYKDFFNKLQDVIVNIKDWEQDCNMG